MFQTLPCSIGYFKESFLFNELVADMGRILIKVENVGSVDKTMWRRDASDGMRAYPKNYFIMLIDEI